MSKAISKATSKAIRDIEKCKGIKVQGVWVEGGV